MIKYKCENCDGLYCDTSICPVCEERTYIEKSEIYYCEKCNVPVFENKCNICNNDCKYIGTDIRPVFPEERLLLECILANPFDFINKSIWNTSGNNYFINGKKQKIVIKDIIKNIDANGLRNRIEQNREKNKIYEDEFYNDEFIQKFILANKIRFNSIVSEATEYIRGVVKGYNYDEMFISFSGGKDSTVTSDLVMNALNNESIIHIYGDTTLEYPETGVYLKKFKEKYPKTPVLVAKNKEQNFNELCKIIGPPSRMMRWCCTVFKTGAITRKIDSTYKNKRKVLSFQGLRRNESAARSKYERESNGAKITKQQAIAPIIDWLDFDVWLYILTQNIPFNNAYKKGFSRVGCWCCPNNSYWSEYLSHIYMKSEYENFHDVLVNFAKQIKKPDPIEYISSGGWKARQGGNGLRYSRNTVLNFKPCVLEENSFNFELNKPLNEMMYELFKPFGFVDYEIGNKRLGEVYVLDRKNKTPILKISGKIGQNILKVTIIKFNKIFANLKISEMLIKNQIIKFQTCISCMACESVCKFNALNIKKINDFSTSNQSVLYKIDENKCVGCLECVKHFSGGCYMKKVLRTKLEKG